jgi:hypothetical protein
MNMIHSRFAAAVLAAILAVSMMGSALAQSADPSAQAQAAAPASSAQVPQPDSGVNWPGAGYGAAALFGNVLYIPAKLVYAILGGLVGGGTWLITAGNTQAANTVWRSALGGDYVLTPQMVAGQQPINFSGPTETPPAAPAATADASANGGVQPITPIPPAASASTAAPAAVPSVSNASGSVHPMDSGSGPVNSKADSGLSHTSVE